MVYGGIFNVCLENSKQTWINYSEKELAFLWWLKGIITSTSKEAWIKKNHHQQQQQRAQNESFRFLVHLVYILQK